MFPPFPEAQAYEVCKSIINDIDSNRVAVKLLCDPNCERASQGFMIGALVCKTNEMVSSDGNSSNGKVVVLKTVSGMIHKLCPGEGYDTESIYVESIVSSEKINEALAKNDDEIHALTAEIETLKKNGARVEVENSESVNQEMNEASNKLRALMTARSKLTNESLAKVYDLYSFHCANVPNDFTGASDVTVRSLTEICAVRNKGNLPPTGTGDCCAPKLLDYCFAHHMVPLSMCEVFYGKSTQNKSAGEKYAPCDERCGIVLPEMLGLKILYRDDDIIVVDKQSGVLSVPGRGPEKADCIVSRVKRLFPNCMEQPSVHRLDMETSGILVLTFTEAAHRSLSKQFEASEIQKEYVALLDGVLAKKGIAQHGEMELYFRLDVDNRPHQIWDTVYGKKAITEWQIVDVEDYHAPCSSSCANETTRPVTRVRFTPHTGRTHQLRLASASEHGFNVPIVGDTLYGKCAEGERLMLHAEHLVFTHPTTGERMEYFSAPEF